MVLPKDPRQGHKVRAKARASGLSRLAPLPPHLAGGGAAAYVDPASDPLLEAWFRADEGLYQDTAKTTPATAADDPVGAWEDKTGAYTLEQGTAGNQPLLKKALAGIGGYDALQFDGSNDFLEANSLTDILTGVDKPVSIIALARQTSAVTSHQFLFAFDRGISGSNDGKLWLERQGSPQNYTVYLSDDSGTVLSERGSTNVSDDLWRTHTIIRTDNGHTLYLNGAFEAEALGSLGQITTTLFTLGGVRAQGSLSAEWRGFVVEFIVIAGATAHREDHEAYLAARYGL